MDNPGERLFALETVAHSAGWMMFCAEHRAKLAALETKLMDPGTSDEETRLLKLSRLYLIKEHSPETVMETMIRIARNATK